MSHQKLKSGHFAQKRVVVHPITSTKEEHMVPYWNVMFDDVEAGRDATPDDESKGVEDADQDFEATSLSEQKRKAKKGYHTRVGTLPSSSQSVRQFEECSVTLEVLLRTIVKALEEEQHAHIGLAAKLKRL